MRLNRSKWFAPTIVALVAVIFGASYFLNPQFAYQLSTVSSVLKNQDFNSAKMLLVLNGARNPLAVVLYGVWQAVAAPLPFDGVIRAASSLYGAVPAIVLSWLGMFLGSLANYGIARGLLGGAFSRWRDRVFGPATSQPATASRWVLLGLRAIPFLPQDILSYVLGLTRVRFVDYLWASALGAVPVAVMYSLWADEIPASTFALVNGVLAAVGVVILAWQAYANRSRLPIGTISPKRKRALGIGSAIVAIVAAAYLFVPGVREWAAEATGVLSTDPSAVAAYLRSFGIWGPIVSAVLMVLQSVAAPLPAFLITFANGMIWGWLGGVLLSWSSAMAGAALCFWIARSLGRPVVEKLVGGSKSLGVSDLFFERYGNKTVFVARLLPFVSFDLISYGAGLTSMGFWKFFLATGLGQLPATIVYSYLASVGGAAGSVKILLYVFIATAVLLVLGSSLRPWYMTKIRRETGHEVDEDDAEVVS